MAAADAAFRAAYPDAPDQMISAAVFHVYTDGIDAALEWLADAERFLRNPQQEFGYGTSVHLLYHVYNWHQLHALMPLGRSGVTESLDELSKLAKEGDLDGVQQVVAELKAAFEASLMPPDFQ